MPSSDGAIERLYEDADVRDELKDDEANTLLKWAEDRLNTLASQSVTDEEFDAKATQFRALLKGMNRLVGNRATLDAATLDARLADLASQAAAVAASGQATAQAAPTIPADQLKDVAGKLPSLDDAGAVNTLTALFTPNALTPSASPTAPVAAQTQSAAKLAPTDVPAASEPVAQTAPPAAEVTPARGKREGPDHSSPAPAIPAPAQDKPDDDSRGGLFHEFAIHFWHPRKKTPPQ